MGDERLPKYEPDVKFYFCEELWNGEVAELAPTAYPGSTARPKKTIKLGQRR